MTITIHRDFDQGSQAWLDARCGLLTASEIKLILTPTLKVASNDKERAHIYELLAQRITRYVEPHYISDDMLRGHDDEVRARSKYAEMNGEVDDGVAFMTNDRWGFTLGYSPDGLVGEDGAIECKSRRMKYQVQTICEGGVPAEYMLQLQTGLLVSERQWVDFVSYSGGLPMYVCRVLPDATIQEAIVDAAAAFEARLTERLRQFKDGSVGLAETERHVEMEIVI